MGGAEGEVMRSGRRGGERCGGPVGGEGAMERKWLRRNFGGVDGGGVVLLIGK